MTDPPRLMAGEDAGGTVPAPHSSGTATSMAAQSSSLSIGVHCADQGAEDEAGFTMVRSRKAKQAEKRAAVASPSPKSRSRSHFSPRGRRSPRKAVGFQKENWQGKEIVEKKGKRESTAFDKAFYELRKWIREQADMPTILVLFARVQRVFRSKAQEARYKFDRVFHEGKPEEEQQLRAVLEEWLTVEKIWVPEFQARLKTILLKTASSEPAASSSASWRDKLLGRVQEKDEMDTAMEAPAEPKVPDDWTVQKRELTEEEQGVIQSVLRGAVAQEHPLECVKATHDLVTHAFLSSAQDSETRGVLVVQLEGNMRLADTATLESRLRMLGGITAAQLTQLDAFKRDLYNIQYESTANRLVFIMKTKESACKWDQSQLIIQNRIMELKRPRTEDDQDAAATVALMEYELTCWEPAGVLDAFQIWHLFHGLLRLRVKSVLHAPPQLGSQMDPTQWRVVLEGKGCPSSIKDKTRVQWQGRTLWLHHHVFYSTPPCHRCGHPKHQAKACTAGDFTFASGSIAIDGPLLEVSEDKKSTAGVSKVEMNAWLHDLALRHSERSAMAGEDHVVGEFVPVGTAPQFIGRTDPTVAKRRAFERRVKAAEVWIQRVVNNLERIKDRYVTSYEFRMRVYYAAHPLPLPYWYSVPALTSEERERRYWACIEGAAPEHYTGAEPDPENLELWVPPKLSVLPIDNGKCHDSTMSGEQEVHGSGEPMSTAAEGIAVEVDEIMEGVAPTTHCDQDPGVSASTDESEMFAQHTPLLASAADQNEEKSEAAPVHERGRATMRVTEEKSRSTSVPATKRRPHVKSSAQIKAPRRTNREVQEKRPSSSLSPRRRLRLEMDTESLSPVPFVAEFAAALANAPPNFDLLACAAHDAEDGVEETVSEATTLRPRKVMHAASPRRDRSRSPRKSDASKFHPYAKQEEDDDDNTSSFLHSESSVFTYGSPPSVSTSPEMDAQEADVSMSSPEVSSHRSVGAEKHGPVQLTLTHFCEEVNMAETSEAKRVTAKCPQAETLLQEPLLFFPRLELNNSLEAVVVPTTVHQWMELLGAHTVEVPADGHCFYTALHCITTSVDVQHIKTMTKSVAKEVTYMRTHINGTLLAVLPQWIANGSVHVTQLVDHYVGQDTQLDDDKGLVLVQVAIAKARDCDPLKRAAYPLWAGSETIRALGAWMREPVIIMTEDANGNVISIVVYRVVPCLKHPGTERVREDVMQPLEALQLIRELIRQRTLPLLLLRTFSFDSSGRQSGHFTAVRYPQQAYEQWRLPDERERSMRERMNDAQEAVGFEKISLEEYALDKTPVAVYESASEYVPSSQENELYYERARDSPVVTRSTDMDPAIYEQLLALISKDGEPAVKRNAVWQQAHAGNQHCLRAWKRTAHIRDEVAAQLRGPVVTTREASAALLEDPSTWLEMVQTLPYPELLLAQLKPKVLARLGRNLLVQAHERVLDSMLPPTAQPAAHEALTEWRAAMAGDASEAFKWRVGYAGDRWGKMAKLAPLELARLRLPGITEPKCCRLMIVLLSISRTFPAPWTANNPCDEVVEFLRWLKQPQSDDRAYVVALTLAGGEWHGLRHHMTRELSPAVVICSNPTPHQADTKSSVAARN